MNYKEFLISKEAIMHQKGININPSTINPFLYDFQKALVAWACKKGKAAIFADCGLGKTLMQLEWSRLMGGTSLILAPLCVAKQTIQEAQKIDVKVNYVRAPEQLTNGINIANYEIVDHFKEASLNSIVLDESSILKNLAGKTKKKLIELFKRVPYKLCCTATPCPNDIAELGNHAEFLDIMTHAEMLGSFFVNKQDKGMGWVMKPHAKEAFYKWMASWAMCLNSPSDLGFDGSSFVLPELNINHISIPIEYHREGELFFTGMHGIQDRLLIRKDTIDRRISSLVERINQTDGHQWICWCGLNDEADRLHSLLGGQSVNVQGSDSTEKKEQGINDFLQGKYKVLISKPKIAGHGLNLQNANHMAFVGLSDSYESYYQCIRREWRYGQKNKVNVDVVLTSAESEIFQNVLQKESEAKNMSQELIKNMEEFEKAEMGQIAPKVFNYDEKIAKGENWELRLGDSCEILPTLEENSIDFSVYSPPFISLYTYSASPRDLGNCKNDQEFTRHYRFLIKEILRTTKPGRNTAVHVSQVPAMLSRDGYIGLKDFRGLVVRLYQKAGWIYHGEVVIQKNPQAQAVRTKAKSLMFAQLKRDSSWLRPGLADYILLFRKPGENQVPIIPNDISNEDWIRWAHPVWYDIKESNTLSKGGARSEDDEKHICPLQLDVILRCIRLWSNPGELVLSPFAGICSEGYEALLTGRRFLGIELKPEYYEQGKKYLKEAECFTNRQLSIY